MDGDCASAGEDDDDGEAELALLNSELAALDSTGGGASSRYISALGDEDDVNDAGEWAHWRERVVPWQYPTDKDPSFAELLIPTLDSIRYEAQLRMLVPAQKPVLFTGAPGVSKTATLMQYIQALNSDEWLRKTVPFSFVTTPEIFQRTLESCVEKRQGRTYGMIDILYFASVI